jgi:glycosyltransferase involved in cell wall biosynthesis
MKICTADSSRYQLSQIDRIEQGFRDLGHEIVQDHESADLVYQNNGWYDSIVAARPRIRGKVILNVLDLAPHASPPFDVSRLRAQLTSADAVTAISTWVQSDLRVRAGVESTVIYNPIKPVSNEYVRRAHQCRALFVGRVNDAAKRTAPAAAALQILGFDATDVITVGSDCPFYGGAWMGVVNDQILNKLYNSVDFVMFPSGSNEGLGLPATEAVAAGAIPVICRDLSTREEFFPSAIFPEYVDVEATPESIARFVGRYMNDEVARAELKARLFNHYQKNWAAKLSGLGVAQAILDVYNRL